MAVRLLLKHPAKASDDAADDLRAAGWDEAQIAAMTARPEPEFAGLWPQHVLPLRALQAAMTQWRTAISTTADGFKTRVTGLDYAAASIAWERLGIVLDAAAFDALQIMEGAAVSILNGEQVS